MTIGIAVHGPQAARAALAGLEAVEAVGRGAIGGFVSLSVITPGRKLIDLGVQRGGAQAMLAQPGMAQTDGARLAVLMSSGPDRPEPLSQFTPCDPAAGLITGHRLPNMPGPDGIVPNRQALEALRAGATPEAAVQAAFAPRPQVDAGLIVMSLAGEIALGNSAAVAARDDIGAAHFVSETLSVGILHNTIFPHHALADLALSAIRDRVAPADAAPYQGQALGLSVVPGAVHALLVEDDQIVGAEAVGPEWLRPDWEGCPVRRGDPVKTGGRVVGQVVAEAYCTLANGVVTGTRGSGTISWKRTDKT
ncbi:MAG: hypothetical protein CML68_12465 [Rhodobacteraceae bacterium]|nr:hypothetical protein [Paracoccaceae bacterium]